MPRKPLDSLGAMVKAKRGERRLREVAAEIGIGTATLMRVENGRIPDVGTFGKLCKWLHVDPGSFLGFTPKSVGNTSQDAVPASGLILSAHFKAEQTPQPETVRALAQMLLLAARTQPRTQESSSDGGA